MRLAETTWPHVARYLEGCKGIIIPVGSTEQHGPCGPIGTDALVAQAIAEQAARHGPWLVAPTLSLAPAQFNLAFAGTISLRASTLMAVVGDVLNSLASQGFERFYFLNGHGANIATVQAACQDFYAQWSLGQRSGQAPQCRLRSWWDYPLANDMRRELYGHWEGMHATPSELSPAVAGWRGRRRGGPDARASAFGTEQPSLAGACWTALRLFFSSSASRSCKSCSKVSSRTCFRMSA
jgi:creatinine amidohydrolase